MKSIFYLFITCMVLACKTGSVTNKGESMDEVLKTDKNTSDTASNRCPNGFIRFDDSCYRFITQSVSWTDAVVFCKLFDLNLPKLRSKKQLNFLKTHLKSISASTSQITTDNQQHHQHNRQAHQIYQQQDKPASQTGFWLGGTDALVPGQWVWIEDKSEVNFSDWGSSPPSSFSNGCLGLSNTADFKEAVFPCGQSNLYFICEKT